MNSSNGLKQGIISFFAALVLFANPCSSASASDIGGFPVNTRTDLHIRAPHQGYHSRERVKLDDLFNHIDLFTYIVLRLDGVSLRFDKNEGRLYPSGADQ